MHGFDAGLASPKKQLNNGGASHLLQHFQHINFKFIPPIRILFDFAVDDSRDVVNLFVHVVEVEEGGHKFSFFLPSLPVAEGY